MRVAFVSAATSHHRDDDRTRRLGRVAGTLADRGHDVDVLCAQWWEGRPDAFEEDGVTYHAVAQRVDDSLAVSLPGRLRNLDPDVVHASYDRPGNVVGASVGATLAGAPLLVDWYDVDDSVAEQNGTLGGVRRALGRRLRRRAVRAPDRVIAPSRTVRTRLREVGVPLDAIEIIPNGVDYERIRETEPKDGGEIVFSRRLDEDANVGSMLLALAEYRERGWRATVVGDGPARERYERQARDLRIDDRVTFAGDLSEEERVALFRSAHVYVHTALRTAFPTDLACALACGCVGIVEYHADSSAHELVEHRDRGFLATDDEEVVECIAEAADLPHRSIDESFDQFDQRTVLGQYLDCYRELLADADLL